jgi:hypothetical protein
MELKNKKATLMRAFLTHLLYGRTTVAPRLKCAKVISTTAVMASVPPDTSSGEPLATETSIPVQTESLSLVKSGPSILGTANLSPCK